MNHHEKAAVLLPSHLCLRGPKQSLTPKRNTSADNSVTGKSFSVEANPTAPSSTASFESDFENSFKASIQELLRLSEEYEEMELQLESK